MPTYAMVARVAAELIRTSEVLEDLEQKRAEKAETHCPEVGCSRSCAIPGPYDYLDLVEA